MGPHASASKKTAHDPIRTSTERLLIMGHRCIPRIKADYYLLRHERSIN